MRAVTAATAAAILELDQKTFDNLLLRIGPSAVPAGRQGVERRIPVSLLEDLMLTRDLSQGLGIPSREAFGLARRLLGRTEGAAGLAPDADFVGSLHAGSFVHVGADVRALRDHVHTRLEAAVETVVRRPRGRPPKGSVAPVLGDA